MLRRSHTYIMDFLSLAAAGGNAERSFTVEQAYRFEIMKLSAYIFDANGDGINPATWPRIVVTLRDGSTTQNLSNLEVAVANSFGQRGLPVVLPARHIVLGGATFLAAAVNRHTANVYSVQLAFQGLLVSAGAESVPVQRRR